MAKLPNVLLNLSSRPENVLLVRETLTAVAEATGIEAALLSDVRTAAAEASNNVVMHAYPGGVGPLELAIELAPGTLAVVVRDHGVGLSASDDGRGLATSPANDAGGEVALSEVPSEEGIGLPVIAAVSDEVELGHTDGGGAEVRMLFRSPELRAPAEPHGSDHLPPAIQDHPEQDITQISIAPVSLARAILPRLLAILAARANLSTDRISDSQLLADELVARAADSLLGDRLNLAVTVEPRGLELRIGPLRAGRATMIVRNSDVRGLGHVLEKLADRLEVFDGGSHDELALALSDRRADAS